MRLKRALEKLKELFGKWGLSEDDWVLIADYAFRLQGYNVKVREGHLNVMINEEKLPWKVSLKTKTISIFPPKNSKEAKQYEEWMKTTKFDTDLIPVSSKEMKEILRNSILYTLPNGEKIRVMKPLAMLKKMEEHLKHCTEEEAGKEKGAYLLEHVEDCRRAAIEKGDEKLTKECERILAKYAFLRKEKAEVLKEVKELKGQIACKGIVKGKVRVILDENKAYELKKGEILVTKMTSPKFTIVINRAIGIITDDGGMLCHAAILAREYNIPCVVGTKIATKILKTGELVELNAERGIVRKLK
jgi:phosphohistidine swiveling domain-containing protein